MILCRGVSTFSVTHHSMHFVHTHTHTHAHTHTHTHTHTRTHTHTLSHTYTHTHTHTHTRTHTHILYIHTPYSFGAAIRAQQLRTVSFLGEALYNPMCFITFTDPQIVAGKQNVRTSSFCTNDTGVYICT